MKYKKKVLFFVSPTLGGASRMTITIAKLLDRNFYDVRFVVWGKEIQEIKNYIPKEYPMQLLKVRSLWNFLTIRLVFFFKKEKPDIVFGSLRLLNIRLALAAKIVGGIKTVFRNDNGIYALQKHDKILLKMAYPFSDIVITQQEEMQKELEEFVPSLKGRVITLYNYLDFSMVDRNLNESNPYINQDEIRFVWAGRITKTKGQDILLKAFKQVTEKISNAHLYLLGKYDEKDIFYKSLQDYIKNNKLSDCVHFMGLQINPHKWLKYAHCFVLPSRLEGLPNAMVEAMYIGIPVVASECIPIIRRMIEEGQNGYVVPVEDSKSMAEAMIKALSLKNCKITYKPSTAEDYRKLF